MKKSIKKYVGGVPELMTPRIASVKTADVPLVSGTPKQVSIAEQPGFSFKDKAGAYMSKAFSNPNIGGMASSLGSSIAMLINSNKKDPNPGRPYKNGIKDINTNTMKNKKSNNLIKYQDGTQSAPAAEKKPSLYRRLDAKLRGILPGGVDRKEYRNKKNAEKKNAESKPLIKYSENYQPGAYGPGYSGYNADSNGDGVADYLELENPQDKVQSVTPSPQSSTSAAASPTVTTTTTAPKKSLMQQYRENKGGYARALKSGKKDAKGNVIDPETGLAYKDLRGKQGGSRQGGSKKNPVVQKNTGLSGENLMGIVKYAQSKNQKPAVMTYKPKKEQPSKVDVSDRVGIGPVIDLSGIGLGRYQASMRGRNLAKFPARAYMGWNAFKNRDLKGLGLAGAASVVDAINPRNWGAGESFISNRLDNLSDVIDIYAGLKGGGKSAPKGAPKGTKLPQKYQTPQNPSKQTWSKPKPKELPPGPKRDLQREYQEAFERDNAPRQLKGSAKRLNAAPKLLGSGR